MTKPFGAKALTVALAASAVFALTAGTARADVLATSVVQLKDFLLKKAGTNTVLDNSDFSFLTFTNTGDVGASFNGSVVNPPGSSGTPLDLPLVCAGPSCGGPNTAPVGLTSNGFEKLAGPGLIGSFAAADQKESGSPITGVGNPLLPTPAKVDSAAYVQIKAPVGGLGSGTANNGLSGTFVFKLTTATAIDLSFLADYYREVYVTADEGFPGFAQSRATVNFNFVNLSAGGATVFDWSPAALNWNSALNAPLPFDISLSAGANNAAFLNTTPVLAANTLYQFSFRTETLADAARNVPEPGTLALVAITLVGLGLSSRRRNAPAVA